MDGIAKFFAVVIAVAALYYLCYGIYLLIQWMA